MNKEIIDDEIEFPDDIISFLKVKYPKAHTDQEKAVLKQMEQLTEERKELKDIVNKKREQEKIKSLPINITASEEAKEKAIKLVQDGTLQLSSKSKIVDLDDSLIANHNSNTSSMQKPKSRINEDNKKLDTSNPHKTLTASKISFVSAGYAFSDGASKSLEEVQEQNLKRSLSITSSSVPEIISKKSRNLNDGESSESDEQNKSDQERNFETRCNNSSVLRFCGHNMTEDFVRRIVEPYGTVVTLELEERHDNSSNVVVTLENPEVAKLARDSLDSQFLEGRVVNVYFKKMGGDFLSRRPFRRRRGRDFSRFRGRFQFQRGAPFAQMEQDTVLPSHFYLSGGDNDDNSGRKLRWNVPDEGEGIDQSNKTLSGGSVLKTSADRSMVTYDDLDPN